ncbi:MAG: NADPH-dependent FMN reductase [Saprospiraceae bacterium]
MILVISGTNRKGNKTQAFAKHYFETLKAKSNEEVVYLSLEDVQDCLLHGNMYNPDGMKSELKDFQDKTVIPANKWVVVSPEYNGSYPGILKLFIDAISIRNYKENFKNTKILLVGTASGRAGNLRGLDQLTGIFNHVGATVFPNQLPISGIGGLLDENDKINNEETIKAIEGHLDGFLAF